MGTYESVCAQLLFKIGLLTSPQVFEGGTCPEPYLRQVLNNPSLHLFVLTGRKRIGITFGVVTLRHTINVEKTTQGKRADSFVKN